jgi:CheY-like chemotaxis protein
MRTVLIADSDPFQRQLIDMLLAVDNHRLLEFETGRSLLEHLQAHVPDLVIVDYTLPDINGADLCAKMKKVKRLAHVPVILVTAAHKLELVRGVAAAVRADLVLAKPLGDKQLRERVLELLSSSTKPAAEPASQATPIHLDPILEQALENIQVASSQSLSPLLSSPTLPPVFTQAEFVQRRPSSKSLENDSDTNKLTPILIDRDEDAPYHLELDSPLKEPEAPSIISRQFSSAFQENADAALEAILGKTSEDTHAEPSTKTPSTKTPSSKTPSSLDAPKPDHLFDTDGFSSDGAISEQELLDSLRTPIGFEPHAFAPHLQDHVLEVDTPLETLPPLNLTPSDLKPTLNPPPFEDKETPHPSGPQAFTLGTAEPQTIDSPRTASVFSMNLDETVSEIELEMRSLRAQVQQLRDENERLRATLLELEQGQSLATSKGYLDALEELELVRRLSDIQVKQLDSLQRQNQKLMEDARASQERRRGLFGFLQPKNPSE